MISRGTAPRLMAGWVAGHDVLNDCAEESVVKAAGLTRRLLQRLARGDEALHESAGEAVLAEAAG